MKKLIIATLGVLMLIPCVSHSMNNDEDERNVPKNVKINNPSKNQNTYPRFKGYGGRFVGTDKRDVAVFEESSGDTIVTRFVNVLGSWGWQIPSDTQKKTKE